MNSGSCQSLQDRIARTANIAKEGLFVVGKEAVAGLKTAQHRAADVARSARAGTRRTLDEFPVETVAVVAAAAFVAGILLRVMRSRRYA
jgi:ElaB/YqjD/DUF883 family membrane-anchored ribosome-binding protein